MGTWDLRFTPTILLRTFDPISASSSATAAAVDRLMRDYAPSLNDQDEAPVFWLALADTQWQLGRLETRTQQQALRVIDSGQGSGSLGRSRHAPEA